MKVKTFGSALVALSILAGMAICTPVNGHDWYPLECCHAQDCAAVESSVRLVPAGGGVSQLIVTSKHGTAVVPNDLPVRESKDSRMHVCMRRDLDYVEVTCLFMPPGA
jgi:hypothetical protein